MMETFSAWLERQGLEEQPILNTWEFKPPKKKKKKKLKRTRCVVIKKEVDIEALLKHRPRGYKSTAWSLQVFYQLILSWFFCTFPQRYRR